MTLTAMIRAGDRSETRVIETVADSYEAARTALEAQVPQGWVILHFREP